MKSTKHSELQTIGKGYLLQKNFWICGEEVPMPPGICDVWGMSRSDDYKTMAIEVKVSRPDFRSTSQKYKEIGNFPLGNYQYILLIRKTGGNFAQNVTDCTIEKYLDIHLLQTKVRIKNRIMRWISIIWSMDHGTKV